MEAAITFEASKREKTGRGASRALRREGFVPAIVYANGKENISLTVQEKEITREYLKGSIGSKVIALQSGKETVHVLTKDIQKDPVSDRIEHVDFQQIVAGEVISVKVPVRFLNRERCVGIKRGGTLNIVRHSVELTCTPESIPEKLEIDLAKLNIGESVHIGSMALPDGVTPTITDRDFTVATITGRGKKDEAAETAEGEAVVAAGDVPSDKGGDEAKKAE